MRMRRESCAPMPYDCPVAPHMLTLRFGRYGIDILTTVPPPRLPSKVKKFAMGDSRAASAFRMSCASMPPMTAHTGEISCTAVIAIVLHRNIPSVENAEVEGRERVNQSISHKP